MHWVTGKPQACEDFRSRFSIYCTTRCGRSTWVKTKKQGPRQNHRIGCLQRSLVEIKRLKQFTKYSAAFTIRPDSSPFLWANHGLSLLFSKCISSRHTWSDTRCLCGILHSVSAHRTLSICFLAVWLFASLVILDSFLPPSIIAHVFFLFLFVYTKSLPFCAAELLPSGRTLCAKGTWWAATKGVVLRKPYFTGRKSDKSQDAKAETPDARLPALCINAYLYL